MSFLLQINFHDLRPPTSNILVGEAILIEVIEQSLYSLSDEPRRSALPVKRSYFSSSVSPEGGGLHAPLSDSKSMSKSISSSPPQLCMMRRNCPAGRVIAVGSKPLGVIVIISDSVRPSAGPLCADRDASVLPPGAVAAALAARPVMTKTLIRRQRPTVRVPLKKVRVKVCLRMERSFGSR